MNENMPTMATASHAHSTYTPDQLFAGRGQPGPPGTFVFETVPRLAIGPAHQPTHQALKESTMIPRRVVQVFVADLNENVPLEDCILFEGKTKVTDLTDQELFFELDIKTLLAEHNQRRVKIVDKKVKDRTEHLEPAKVRDLKMTVVVVATL